MSENASRLNYSVCNTRSPEGFGLEVLEALNQDGDLSAKDFPWSGYSVFY